MSNYNIPEDLRFTKTHEWVRHMGKNKYRIGITDYAAKHIGDVTYVELPEPEEDLDKDESGCVVETVKSSEDVYNPIAGTVAANNDDLLAETPEMLNKECYTEGWLYEIKAESDEDFTVLMTADEYDKYLDEVGE